jgi:thioesterase domain-containing protein
MVYDCHRPSWYDGRVTYYTAHQSLPVVGNSAAAWRRVAPWLAVTEVPGRHLQLLGPESVVVLAAEVAAGVGESGPG